MFVQTGNHYGAAPAPCKEPLAAHILAAPRFIACVLAAPCPCRPRPCCTTHQPLASSSDAHAKNTVSPTRWPHLGQPPLCRLALNSMTDTEGPPTLFCISAGTDHQTGSCILHLPILLRQSRNCLLPSPLLCAQAL